MQSLLQRSILLLLILFEIHLDVFPSAISLLSICQRFPMYGATDEELAEAVAIAGQTDHFLKYCTPRTALWYQYNTFTKEFQAIG